LQQIRTKWHKLLPLIDANEVYLTSAPGKKARHWSEFGPNPALAKQFIGLMDRLPKFVIADQLLPLTDGEKFQQSLADMKTAGVLRLPYPAMIVEFNSGLKTRSIVMLRDNRSEERFPWEPPARSAEVNPLSDENMLDKDFYGCVFRIEHDSDGEYLVLAPGVVAMSIEANEGAPWLKIWADLHDLCTPSAELNDLLGATYSKDSGVLWRALSSALLIITTEGTKREVIDCERINRTRGGKSGKPLVPAHTYISIGRVYRSSEGEESDEYTPRLFTPRWRRGYLQPVRFGPGWSQRRVDYIPPRWIDAKGHHEEAPGPFKEYHVNK
jgi:hypothetical protein